MAQADPKRRHILSLILGGAFALGLGVATSWLLKFLRPAKSIHKTWRRSGTHFPKRELPARGALVSDENRVALVRDAAGVRALDLHCTHLGCTVQVTATEWVCPCHGSRFDTQGRVLKGPAVSALARLEFEDEPEFYRVFHREKGDPR